MAQAIAEAARILGLTNVQPLAAGAQKQVCRAEASGGSVVLKVVVLAASPDPMALERCVREVDLLKDLQSPHIVRVLSDLVLVGSGPDAAAWLEEELDGSDLGALVGNRWSWPDTFDLLSGIGTGLALMHQRGYIHRDLSPNNVRRTAAGVWKIMDPGLAKHLNRSSITALGQPGTPGYMSPEHAAFSGRVTPASDVFCLGILGFLTLVGDVPIPVAPDIHTYRQRLARPAPISVAPHRPDLAPERARVIDRALTIQPARRYLDAGEFVTALTTAGRN